MKSDVVLLADVFQKNTKGSDEEFEINLLHCVSLPGYTWQCDMEYTNIRLQTLQEKKLFLTLEKNIRARIKSILGDHYMKSTENENILYVDSIN